MRRGRDLLHADVSIIKMRDRGQMTQTGQLPTALTLLLPPWMARPCWIYHGYPLADHCLALKTKQHCPTRKMFLLGVFAYRLFAPNGCPPCLF